MRGLLCGRGWLVMRLLVRLCVLRAAGVFMDCAVFVGFVVLVVFVCVGPWDTCTEPPVPAPRAFVAKPSTEAIPGNGADKSATVMPLDAYEPYLDRLVPSWRSIYTADRLRAIESATLGWWHDYVRAHFVDPGRKVRVLIVAEAAPFKPTGKPIAYVYKPDDPSYSGTLLGALSGGLGRVASIKNDAANKAATLQFLGEQGLLLCDPLPVSLDYSGKNVTHSGLREKAAYGELCALGWRQCVARLEAAGVQLDPECVVAFSLPKSCRAVLQAHSGLLPLPGGRCFAASEKTHCFVNASQMPGAKELANLLAAVNTAGSKKGMNTAGSKEGMAVVPPRVHQPATPKCRGPSAAASSATRTVSAAATTSAAAMAAATADGAEKGCGASRKRKVPAPSIPLASEKKPRLASTVGARAGASAGATAGARAGTRAVAARRFAVL